MQALRRKNAIERDEAEKGGTRGPFWSTVGSFYSKRIVRRCVVVVVLVAVALVEYSLTQFPVADIERAGKFAPARVAAGDEQVSFLHPQTEPGTFAFAYKPAAELAGQRLLVDAYLDQARLSDETISKLRSLGVSMPVQTDAATYLTSGLKGSICATTFQVDSGKGEPTAVQFYQSESAASDRYRLLEAKVLGTDVVMEITSSGAFDGDASPCHVKFSVGSWKLTIGGFMPIKFQIPAGSAFRFRWEAQDVKSVGWSSAGSPVQLITFGSHLRRGFDAEEIAVRAASTDKLQPPRLLARQKGKTTQLQVTSVLVGTDRLEVSVSGKGLTYEAGKIAGTRNIVELISKNAIVSALFGALNLALLGWAGRQFWSSRRKRFQ